LYGHTVTIIAADKQSIAVNRSSIPLEEEYYLWRKPYPWNSIKEPHHHNNTKCESGNMPSHTRFAGPEANAFAATARR
jgi:hypothetical protein